MKPMFGKLAATVAAVAILSGSAVAQQQAPDQSGPFISQQAENELRVEQLVGNNVVNVQGEDLGEVEDLVVSDAGEVTAIVVGVGGFLGLGEKSVAIGWDQVDIARDEEMLGEVVLTLDQDRATLEAAPDFIDLEQIRAQERAEMVQQQPLQGPGLQAAIMALDEAQQSLEEDNREGAQQALEEARMALQRAAAAPPPASVAPAPVPAAGPATEEGETEPPSQ